MTDAVGYFVAFLIIGAAAYGVYKHWRKRRLSKVDFDVGTPTAPGGNPHNEPPRNNPLP
jgi:hypothetical protein